MVQCERVNIYGQGRDEKERDLEVGGRSCCLSGHASHA